MELVKKTESANIIKKIILVLLGTLLLTISAKIKVPFYPVPMTMQTFVVVLIGITFGWKLGLTTIFAYLFEGAVGLPVFAGTPEKGIGISYMVGPTGGYLIGFIFACMLAGYFQYSKNYFLNFVKILLSTSLIYAFGLLWLGTLIGWDKPILKLGMFPFLYAELFKILLLTVIVNKVIKLRNFI